MTVIARSEATKQSRSKIVKRDYRIKVNVKICIQLSF